MQELHAGLDVADRTTAICILDECGDIVLEDTAETTPDSIAAVLRPYRRRLKTVGQETGTKSVWLHKGLERAKYPIRSLDARIAHAALKARINKTDQNDARGIASLLVRGIYTTSYIKSDEAIRVRMILNMRDALLRKNKDLQGLARSIKKQLGIEAKPVKRRAKGTGTDSEVSLQAAMASLERMRKALEEEISELDRLVQALADGSPVCQRLMTIPGVGVITALTFIAAVDDPHRFKSSRDVGSYFGLTPRTFQSGGASRSGGISHRGDTTVRRTLYMAARSLLINSHSGCSMKRWGRRLMEKKKARGVGYIAVARKLAVLMHHLWITGEDFDPGR